MAQPDLRGSVTAGGEMQIGKEWKLMKRFRRLRPCLGYLSSLRAELDSHMLAS